MISTKIFIAALHFYSVNSLKGDIERCYEIAHNYSTDDILEIYITCYWYYSVIVFF